MTDLSVALMEYLGKLGMKLDGDFLRESIALFRSC